MPAKDLPTDLDPGTDPRVVLGAFARIDALRAEEVRAQLRRLEGVTTFDLDVPHKLGIVLEALDLDAAHRQLTTQVAHISGVHGVWPISVELTTPPPQLSDSPLTEPPRPAL